MASPRAFSTLLTRVRPTRWALLPPRTTTTTANAPAAAAADEGTPTELADEDEENENAPGMAVKSKKAVGGHFDDDALCFTDSMAAVEAKSGGAITVPFYFICVLHLANEKGLRLTGVDDLTDFRVELDSDALPAC